MRFLVRAGVWRGISNQRRSVMAVPRIMRRDEVLVAVGFSYSTLKRKVRAGEFPAPVKLGRRSVGWFATEVEEWITSRERSDMSVF